MYKIEVTDYGIKIIFSGDLPPEDMKKWLEDSIKILKSFENSFMVFVDMRDLDILSFEAREYLVQGQEFYRFKGMKRSVVILNSDFTKMQFQRIAWKTGIYEWERYIDASNTPDWEQIGLDWIIEGIDPGA